jgi:hypothetical protein
MRAVLAAGAAVVVVAACDRQPPPKTPAPPGADFLLAAGDSTFWVTTGPKGVRVRGSPLVLARYGGKFYEIYVADEDHSFYDAVFTSQRIYRRDLLTGDSMAVFLDSSIVTAAKQYAITHPGEQPLASDEDASDDPSTSVTGEVDIVDVHGPYLSYEYRGTQSAKSNDNIDSMGSGKQVLRRGVIDLRSGERITPRALFGQAGGDSAVARGHRAFAATLGAIRAARANGNERARLAAEAAQSFVFDPNSFALTDAARDPGAQFFAPARGARVSGLTLPLTPVSVPEAADMDWWTAERVTLPIGGSDSASDVWARPGIEVVARYDSAGGPQEGQGVVVAIRQVRDARAVAAKPGVGRRDPGIREWRVGRFPSPTRRLYWLDRPLLDSAGRRALVKAFNESALYGDDARSARHELDAWSRRVPRAALVAYSRPRHGPRPGMQHGMQYGMQHGMQP